MNKTQMPFLEEDFRKLEEKFLETKKSVSDLGKDMGEACEQSSETWHDNPALDMVQAEHRIKSEQAVNIRAMFESAVVQPRAAGSKIGLGSKVQMLRLDVQDDQPLWYEVGSSWLPESSAESDGILPSSAIRMSYFSPMSQKIIGKEEDDKVEVRVDNTSRRYFIMEILNE